MSVSPERYRRDGFICFPSNLPLADLERITDAFGTSRDVGSGHRLSALPTELLDWLAAHPVVTEHAHALLGRPARLVRVIAFDKSAAATWFVAWHQDRSIAVRAEHSTDGFSYWTRKDGYVQVEPPVAVLETMVTLRLHLDDCGAASGPLLVLPATHTSGRLDRDAVAALVARSQPRVCLAKRGEIVAMSPLLVHHSPRATLPARRRVLHMEYAAAGLPAGLEWALAPACTAEAEGVGDR